MNHLRKRGLVAVLAGVILVAGGLACNRTEAHASAAAGGAGGAGGNGAANGNVKTVYQTRGMVKGFGEGRKTVRIAHEDIPNYMKAMTMMFAVSAPAVLDGFAEGDAVDFSFSEDDGRLLIASIKKR